MFFLSGNTVFSTKTKEFPPANEREFEPISPSLSLSLHSKLAKNVTELDNIQISSDLLEKFGWNVSSRIMMPR
jgi:hypothetical protein